MGRHGGEPCATPVAHYFIIIIIIDVHHVNIINIFIGDEDWRWFERLLRLDVTDDGTRIGNVGHVRWRRWWGSAVSHDVDIERRQGGNQSLVWF